MEDLNFVGVIPTEHAYAELFEITAQTHALDPGTGELKIRQEEDAGLRYNEIVEGVFPILYGCSTEEIKSLVAQVDKDVEDMFRELEDLTPQDFEA